MVALRQREKVEQMAWSLEFTEVDDCSISLSQAARLRCDIGGNKGELVTVLD